MNSAAPPISAVFGIDDATGEDRALWFEALAGDFEAEFIESAERGQVGAVEAGPGGSVGHVEVFRMVSVGTSILGRPRPLSQDRRASARYTLIWEEPVYDGPSPGSSRIGLPP